MTEENTTEKQTTSITVDVQAHKLCQDMAAKFGGKIGDLATKAIVRGMPLVRAEIIKELQAAS